MSLVIGEANLTGSNPSAELTRYKQSKKFEWTGGTQTLYVGDSLKVTKGKVRLVQRNNVVQTWVPGKLYVGGSTSGRVIPSSGNFRITYRFSYSETSMRDELSRLRVAVTKGKEFFEYPSEVGLLPEFFHVVTVSERGESLPITIRRRSTEIFKGSLKHLGQNVYSSPEASAKLAVFQSDSETLEILVESSAGSESTVFYLAPKSTSIGPVPGIITDSPITQGLERCLFYAKNGLVGLLRLERKKLADLGVPLEYLVQD